MGDIRELTGWVALMVLTTLEDEQAIQEARYLLARNRKQETQVGNRAIIELITTIMVYKFDNKSQREVEEINEKHNSLCQLKTFIMKLSKHL